MESVGNGLEPPEIGSETLRKHLGISCKSLWFKVGNTLSGFWRVFFCGEVGTTDLADCTDLAKEQAVRAGVKKWEELSGKSGKSGLFWGFDAQDGKGSETRWTWRGAEGEK